MKYIQLFIVSVLLFCSCSRETYDVIIYGGTASGVISATSASRMGAKVLLIGPDVTLGGMTTGGLGQTDIGNKQAISGLSRQFYRKVGEHYGEFEKWTFEPHVAEEILENYLKGENVTVIREAYLDEVIKVGQEIKSIICSGKTYSAKQFIDCSYEGDLMAMAGVSYRIGRESNFEYGETWNGSHLLHAHQFPDGIDPYIEPGNPESGLLWGISTQQLKEDGQGDSLVQAYNYRICLTDDPENMIAIEKPENYDSTHYDLLVRVIEKLSDRRKLNNWFIWSKMPNHKTDINNSGPFSTDMIGMNYSYPNSDWKTRDSIIKNHKDYTLGLLYFYGHDSRVPFELREQMLKWGLPKDEYVKTNHWTHQLYIREARRMVGEYVATEADCKNQVTITDGVAMAAYTMDSHNCERIVVEKDGVKMVKNEGDVQIGGGKPYPISYRSLTPKKEECTNLLVPVCLSASHIAYGSIRMEPVFMATGQAAAIASVIASNTDSNIVQGVDVSEVQRILKENPYLDGTSPELIIDDNNEESVKYIGWTKSDRYGSYGATVLKLLPDSLNNSLTYTVTMPQTGEYVLTTYQIEGDYCGCVEYEIENGNNRTTLTFNRSTLHVGGQTAGEWVDLGKIKLDCNFPVIIRVKPKDDGKPVIADAILLRQ